MMFMNAELDRNRSGYRLHFLYAVYLRGAAKIDKFPLWLLLLVAAILVMPLKGVDTTPDGAWYTANAMSLYKGFGFVEADHVTANIARGPAFPALIALFLALFGESIQAALWVVRAFFAANVLLVYFTGKALYNRYVGLMASLLVLTSFGLNEWSSYILSDSVVAFFINLFFILIFMAFSKKSVILGIISSIVLIIGILTKQNALIAVVFPLVTFVVFAGYRNLRSLAVLFACYVIFIFGIVAWSVRTSMINGQFLLLDRSTTAIMTGKLLQMNQLIKSSRILQEYGDLLYVFYKDEVSANFFYSSLLLVSWIVLLSFGMFKRKKEDILLVIATMSYIAYFLWGYAKELRGRYGMYLLLYIILARFLLAIVQRIMTWLPEYVGGVRRGVLTKTASLALIFLVVGAQIPGEQNRMLSLWRGQGVAPTDGGPYLYGMRFLRGTGDWTTGGWHNILVEQAGTWIQQNIPAPATIASDWVWQNSLYFCAGGEYPFVFLPGAFDSNDIYTLKAQAQQQGQDLLLARPLFIWPLAANGVSVFDEQSLLTGIQRQAIDYIVLTPANNFLSLYLDKHPAFTRLTSIGQGEIKIYKVDRDRLQALANFQLMASDSLAEFLQNMREKRPAEAERLATTILRETLGLSEEQSSALYRGKLPTFQLNKVY